MPFLLFSNTDILVDTKSFTYSSYSITEALRKIKRVELINKHDFAKAALEKNSKSFVVYVAVFKVLGAIKIAGISIYPDRANQVQVPALQKDKALTKI